MDFTAENILIAADHPCFEGHFPGHPVFPAVAQIDLVLALLQERWGYELVILSIQKAKFPAPIAPNTLIKISIKSQDLSIFWQIFDEHQSYSLGTLQLAPAVP